MILLSFLPKSTTFAQAPLEKIGHCSTTNYRVAKTAAALSEQIEKHDADEAIKQVTTDCSN